MKQNKVLSAFCGEQKFIAGSSHELGESF